MKIPDRLKELNAVEFEAIFTLENAHFTTWHYRFLLSAHLLAHAVGGEYLMVREYVDTVRRSLTGTVLGTPLLTIRVTGLVLLRRESALEALQPIRYPVPGDTGIRYWP